MLGKSLNYFVDKRRKKALLIRCDTEPNQIDQPINTDLSNQDDSTNCHNATQHTEQNTSSKPINQSQHSHKSRLISSPPSSIKYKIRTKSPAVSRKTSTETPNSSRRSSSTNRSKSIESTSNQLFNQKSLLKNVANVAIQLSKAHQLSGTTANSTAATDSNINAMKLSRSLSKRMPRSGSAKNLMELRDDNSLIWTDGRLMQREIGVLFKAVESNDLKSVESILTNHPNIVNSFNNIDLTALDMAMLYHHSTVAKRLVEFGGKNNEYFETDCPRFLLRHLTLLTNNCATQLLEMGSNIYCSSGTINRDLEQVETFHCHLKQLKHNLEHMSSGSSPRKVTLEVTGLGSLLVTIYPPSDSLVTRYRIEWSKYEDFIELDDEIVVRAQFPVGRYQILDLAPNCVYYIRVAGYNLSGSGKFTYSQPRCEVASCWTQQHDENTALVCAPGISRRCFKFATEWPMPDFTRQLQDIDIQLTQQLQFWLASLRAAVVLPNSTTANGNTSVSTTTITADISSNEIPADDHSSAISNNFSSNNISASKEPKKSLFKYLVNNNSKFVRYPKQGLYLALIYQAIDTDKILGCNDEQVPFIQIEEDYQNTQNVNSDALWLTRLITSSPDLRLLAQLLSKLSHLTPPSLHIRSKFITSLYQLQHTLLSSSVGLLCPPVPACVIPDPKNIYNVITITRILPNAKSIPLPNPLKWASHSKMTRGPPPGTLNLSNQSINNQIELSQGASSSGNLDEDLYQQIDGNLSFYRRIMPVQTTSPNSSPEDGLYLAFMQCRSSLDQLFVLQHLATSPLYLPMIRIRDNWHLDASEWLRISLNPNQNPQDSSKADRFHILLIQAWNRLRTLVKLTDEAAANCRLYIEEVIWLKPRMKLLLVVPMIDQFCLPPGQDHDPPLDLEWTPLWYLELYGTLATTTSQTPSAPYISWTSLTATLTDLLIPLAQHSLRQAFHKSETDTARERLDQLCSLQSELDKIGRQVRWTVDVIANCRDRNLSPVVTVPIRQLVETDPSSRAVLCTEIHCPDNDTTTDSQADSSSNQPITNNNSSAPCRGGLTCPSLRRNRNLNLNLNLPSNPNTPLSSSASSPVPQQQKQGILRIYAGYPTGLLEGTSVKVLLTPTTTALDVVRLIVKQLNQTSIQRNPDSPQYHDSIIDTSFSLVVTIDNMSRPLPDNFHPLLLKQPWKSGKLTVKFKNVAS